MRSSGTSSKRRANIDQTGACSFRLTSIQKMRSSGTSSSATAISGSAAICAARSLGQCFLTKKYFSFSSSNFYFYFLVYQHLM